MKRMLTIAGSLIGLLVLIGIVIALALTLSHQTAPPEQTVTLAAGKSTVTVPAGKTVTPPSFTPAEPQGVQSPTATATSGTAFDSPIKTPTPIKPTPTIPGPDLDDYVFGEPKVVLTHTTAIGIARWLPDGERLLIVRRVPDQTTREYIEVFSVRTGELRRYGERHSSSAKPVWLEAYEAVAYDNLLLEEKRAELVISLGEPGGEKRGASHLYSSHIAVDVSGQRLVFLTESQKENLSILDVGQDKKQVLSPSLPSLESLAASGLPYLPTAYQFTWQPHGNRLAIYNNAAFFLADLSTGDLHQIDLGSGSIYTPGKIWAFHTEWSPDGRYLALKTSAGDLPLKFTDLTILDIATDEQFTIDLGLRHDVHDFAWSSNSRHLVVMGYTNTQGGRDALGLCLVDVVTGKFRRVLLDYETGAGAWGLDWSADGKFIALECPTWEEGRVCLIPVSIQP